MPQDLEINDVVLAGVTSTPYADEIFVGNEILYPDVPIREPAKGYGKIAIISDLHLEQAPLERIKSFIDFFESSKIKLLEILEIRKSF